MPGIVGFITNRPRAVAERELHEMLRSLCHESFYSKGTWINEEQGIYVGWVARRGSFDDGMPLHNETGKVTLFFSGEEFPERGAASALKASGHAVEQDGPSYLVHRYEEELDFPKRLNGRFHGLVVDRERGTATLFNDRFGLQRVYYHEARDTFYFAAEAKAILKVRPELRNMDPRGLGEFIVCGCVLENRSLFTAIHVLPPGSAWVLRGKKLEKKNSYFQPREWEEEEPLKPETYYAALRDIFVQNLPRYFNGNERVGVSLTGGLDTRIIMAWRKAPPNSLPCYTFGSMYRDNQDVRLARRVAQICGQQHQVITTGNEFLARFPYYAERSIYLTDACVDLNRSPDLYVNEKVREIAPVRIVGTYGSEMLLHAVMFKAEKPATGLFQQELESQIHAAKQTYDRSRQVHPMTFVAFRQSPWHHFGVLGLEQTQVAVRSPYLDNDLVKTLYKAPGPISINQEARVRLIREGNPELAELRTDRGIRGVSSIFTRGFQEFLFKAEYAYDYGMPLWIAQVDHLFAPLHLERIWLGRHKVFHFRVWYRDALANYVREMLLDSKSLSRPYVNADSVQKLVDGHLKGNHNYTTEIHRLLTLELAHRLFLDAS
ncbi:MAG: asparagine synthase-related protein [Candidatus Acidiferrum sp.]